MKKIYTTLMLAAAAFSASAQDYTVWPANDATVAEFTKVIFTFGENDDIEVGDDEYLLLLDSNYESYNVVGSVGEADNQFVVCYFNRQQGSMDGASTLSTKGSYNLSIGAGAFKINGVANENMNYKFTIDPAYVSPFTYTINPKEPVVSKIEKIKITFPKATEVTENGLNTTSLRDEREVGVRLNTSIEGNVYTIAPFEAVTTQGSYVLTVPANTLKIDGTVFGEEIIMQYMVSPEEGDFTVVASPAEGNIYSFGKDIKVTFEGASTVAYTPTDTPEAISMKRLSSGEEGDEGETVIGSVLPYALTIDGNTISFNLPEGFPFVAGTYEVTIPAAGIKVDGANPADDIILTYNLKNLIASWNPKAPEVEELTTIAVTFPEISTLAEDVTAGDIVVKDVNLDAIILSNAVIMTNKVEITLRDQNQLVAGHSYQAIIPAGYLIMDGEVYNNELTNTYLYTPELPEFTNTTTPAEGTVTALSTIDVTFVPAEVAEGEEAPEFTLAIASELGTTNAPFLSINDSRVATATAVSVEGLTISIAFNALSENGQYTLTVPGELYTINGIPGDLLTFTYTLEAEENSISQINAANGNATIFNIKGQKVATAKNGLFIINGKKVVR